MLLHINVVAGGGVSWTTVTMQEMAALGLISHGTNSLTGGTI